MIIGILYFQKDKISLSGQGKKNADNVSLKHSKVFLFFSKEELWQTHIVRGDKALLNTQAMADEQSTSGKSHFLIITIIKASNLKCKQMPACITNFNIIDAILDYLQPIYSAASSLSLFCFSFSLLSNNSFLLKSLALFALAIRRSLTNAFSISYWGKENL